MCFFSSFLLSGGLNTRISFDVFVCKSYLKSQYISTEHILSFLAHINLLPIDNEQSGGFYGGMSLTRKNTQCLHVWQSGGHFDCYWWTSGQMDKYIQVKRCVKLVGIRCSSVDQWKYLCGVLILFLCSWNWRHSLRIIRNWLTCPECELKESTGHHSPPHSHKTSIIASILCLIYSTWLSAWEHLLPLLFPFLSLLHSHSIYLAILLLFHFALHSLSLPLLTPFQALRFSGKEMKLNFLLPSGRWQSLMK